MNIDIIKDGMSDKIGRRVVITERGSRNKKFIYEGYIYKMYPNIFSIMTRNGEKTFSYSDIASKTIYIKFQ